MYVEMHASYGTVASRSGGGLPVVKCKSKSNWNLSELFINHLKIKFHVKIFTSLRIVTWTEADNLGEDNRRALQHLFEKCWKWQKNLKGRYQLENVIPYQRIIWF